MNRPLVYTVGVIGARGHVGAELLPMLARHPGVQVAVVGGRELTPQAAADQGLGAWLLAVPNGEAGAYAAALGGAVIIDLSADHRFDPAWVYGLPEIDGARAALRGARRIANPGCYATGIQLALHPLREVLDGPVHAFGVSGYSGAGTTPSPRNDPEQLRDGVLPYGLAGHGHEGEASHHLGHPVRFLPHVAPFFRGITLTLSLTLREEVPAAALQERVAAAYAGEPLVRVTAEVPRVQEHAGVDHVSIGGFAVEGRKAAVVVALDNLRKGAATQAVQNLNLALGLPELAGIAS